MGLYRFQGHLFTKLVRLLWCLLLHYCLVYGMMAKALKTVHERFGPFCPDGSLAAETSAICGADVLFVTSVRSVTAAMC